MLRKDLIITILLAFCLSVTLSQILPIGSQEAGHYDPWYDINDDGKIDMRDIGGVCRKFGTSGTAINKTDLLLDLLGRVEALENQSLPLGYIGPPAYDSGWTSISQGDAITFVHGLGTTEVFVYVLAQESLIFGINHFNYGVDYYADKKAGGYWHSLTENRIKVTRFPDDMSWEQVRVMIWKIAEP